MTVLYLNNMLDHHLFNSTFPTHRYQYCYSDKENCVHRAKIIMVDNYLLLIIITIQLKWSVIITKVWLSYLNYGVVYKRTIPLVNISKLFSVCESQ